MFRSVSVSVTDRFSSQMPPLPGLTPDGRRVIVMRSLDQENILPSVSEGMKVVMMIGDVRLKEELTGVAGDVYILDASIITAAQFAQNFSKFTPTLVKKFLICVQVSGGGVGGRRGPAEGVYPVSSVRRRRTPSS